jgi:LEA14-like dessication related protein
MKKLLPLLLTAGGLFLAIRYFNKARTAKILNIKLRNIKLQPISQAAIVLEIINPTNTDISFTSITGDVLINDIAISTLNYQQPTIINANSSKTISLRIKINPLELAKFAATSLLSRTKINMVKFVANVSGEGLNIPVMLEQQIAI